MTTDKDSDKCTDMGCDKCCSMECAIRVSSLALTRVCCMYKPVFIFCFSSRVKNSPIRGDFSVFSPLRGVFYGFFAVSG